MPPQTQHHHPARWNGSPPNCWKNSANWRWAAARRRSSGSTPRGELHARNSQRGRRPGPGIPRTGQALFPDHGPPRQPTGETQVIASPLKSKCSRIAAAACCRSGTAAVRRTAPRRRGIAQAAALSQGDRSLGGHGADVSGPQPSGQSRAGWLLCRLEWEDECGGRLVGDGVSGQRISGQGTPYGAALNRMIDYILTTPAKNGYLGVREGKMYEHGIATLFLSEVSGMVDPVRNSGSTPCCPRR